MMNRAYSFLLVQEKWTALMAASNSGCYEAVDALLDHGADPNMQDFVSDCGFRCTQMFATH